MILAIIAIYLSMEQIIRNIEFGVVTHGLRISRAWFLAAVLLGFLMVLLRLIQSIKRDLTDVIAGRAGDLAAPRPVTGGNLVCDGARVDPGARLEGGVVVGAGARVEAGSRLARCVVWDGARAAGRLADCIVGRESIVAAGEGS